MSWIVIDSSLKGSISPSNSMMRGTHYRESSQQRGRTPISVTRKRTRKQGRAASSVDRHEKSNDSNNSASKSKNSRNKKLKKPVSPTTGASPVNESKRIVGYGYSYPGVPPANGVESVYDSKSQSFLDRAWRKFGEARILTQQKLFQAAWQALMEAKELIDTAGDPSSTGASGINYNNSRQREALVQLGHELNIATQTWLLRERLVDDEETPTKRMLMRSGSTAATVRALQQEHSERQREARKAKGEEDMGEGDETKNNDILTSDVSPQHYCLHSPRSGISLDIHSSNTNIYLDSWSCGTDISHVNSHTARVRRLWDTTAHTAAGPTVRYSDGIVAAMKRADVWATEQCTSQIASTPSPVVECLSPSQRQDTQATEEKQQEEKDVIRNDYKRYTHQHVSIKSAVPSPHNGLNRSRSNSVPLLDTPQTPPAHESRGRSILDLGEPQLVPLRSFEVVKPTPKEKRTPYYTPIVSVPVASRFDRNGVGTTIANANADADAAAAAHVSRSTVVQRPLFSSSLAKEGEPSVTSSLFVSGGYRGPVMSPAGCHGSTRAGDEMRGGESVGFPQYVNIYNIRQRRDVRQGTGETTNTVDLVDGDNHSSSSDGNHESIKMMDSSEKEGCKAVDLVNAAHDVMGSVEQNAVHTGRGNEGHSDHITPGVRRIQRPRSSDHARGENPATATVDHEASDESVYDIVPLTEAALQHYFDNAESYQEARILNERMVRYLLLERGVSMQKEDDEGTQQRSQLQRPPSSRAAYLLGLLEKSYHDWLVGHLGIKKRHHFDSHHQSNGGINENRQTLSTASVTTSEGTRMERGNETESMHMYEGAGFGTTPASHVRYSPSLPETFEFIHELSSFNPPDTTGEAAVSGAEEENEDEIHHTGDATEESELAEKMHTPREAVINAAKTVSPMETSITTSPQEIPASNALHYRFSVNDLTSPRSNDASKHVEEATKEEEEEEEGGVQKRQEEETLGQTEGPQDEVHPVSAQRRSGRTFVFIREKYH